MGGDKDARLSTCVPEFASGNVWFMDPDVLPAVTQVKKELMEFPKGAFDDCVDMTSYALNWLSENAGVIYGAAPETERPIGRELELDKSGVFRKA